MKLAIKELQKSLKVEKRKLDDYQFKLQQLKEHELLIHESIDDTKLVISDIEETIETLLMMTEGTGIE